MINADRLCFAEIFAMQQNIKKNERENGEKNEKQFTLGILLPHPIVCITNEMANDEWNRYVQRYKVHRNNFRM